MTALGVAAARVPMVSLSELFGLAVDALAGSDVLEVRYVEASVVSVRRLPSGLVVGEMGWGGFRLPFVCRWRSVDAVLVQTVGGWRKGLSALWVARLDLDGRFGVRLQVSGVLASSIGRSEESRRHIEFVNRMLAEDWPARQARLADPGVPGRVAVVSSQGALGLADFCEVAGRVCEIRLVDARMSGAAAAESVAAAVVEASTDAGLVVIARGGGAPSGMEWADSELVARTVTDCRVPVWVAVGHASDRHVIDAVAARSFATPSHAAAELVRRAGEVQAAERAAVLTAARDVAMTDAAGAQRRARVLALTLIGLAFVACVAGVVWWLVGVS